MNANNQSEPLINTQFSVSQLFDQWASTNRAKTMAEGHQPFIDALLQELTSESDSLGSILDLGCGTGAFLAQAAASGFSQTYGIDASPKMIAIAQKAAPEAVIKLGDFTRLPWATSSFNNITTIEAIYYSPEPLLVLQEVVRTLKPGGRFDLIIDYYEESKGTISWSEGVGFEITRLSITQWMSQAATAGLERLRHRRIVASEGATLENWQPSVWYPTKEDYYNYLNDGALWITGFSPS
ncbi:MAG: class I SAM-dependent methyltransferase [Xenococcaceae cyanobacterium MO_167.B27]|nr:class I SAM-dependent methyltransferase [Xenococcaceae cyanobacterium MO_167.B27]